MIYCTAITIINNLYLESVLNLDCLITTLVVLAAWANMVLSISTQRGIFLVIFHATYNLGTCHHSTFLWILWLFGMEIEGSRGCSQRKLPCSIHSWNSNFVMYAPTIHQNQIKNYSVFFVNDQMLKYIDTDQIGKFRVKKRETTGIK